MTTENEFLGISEEYRKVSEEIDTLSKPINYKIYALIAYLKEEFKHKDILTSLQSEDNRYLIRKIVFSRAKPRGPNKENPTYISASITIHLAKDGTCILEGTHIRRLGEVETVFKLSISSIDELLTHFILMRDFLEFKEGVAKFIKF